MRTKDIQAGYMEYLRQIENIVGEKLIHDDGTLVTDENADGEQIPTLPPDQTYSSEVEAL